MRLTTPGSRKLAESLCICIKIIIRLAVSANQAEKFDIHYVKRFKFVCLLLELFGGERGPRRGCRLFEGSAELSKSVTGLRLGP